MKRGLLLTILALSMLLVGCTSHDDHVENLETIHVPHAHVHHHEMMEASEPYPTIDLIVHEDPKGGWNLQVLTEGIILAPESASLEHVEGEGHAHLHIDGSKITRLYGEWYHVPKDWLSAGTYEFSVSLSSNDHKDYTIDGEVISDSEMVVVS